jgi:hypothetical protein
MAKLDALNCHELDYLPIHQSKPTKVKTIVDGNMISQKDW